MNPARSTGPALFFRWVAISQLWGAPTVGAVLHAWFGAGDSVADQVVAARQIALEPGEPLAPRAHASRAETARRPPRCPERSAAPALLPPVG